MAANVRMVVVIVVVVQWPKTVRAISISELVITPDGLYFFVLIDIHIVGRCGHRHRGEAINHVRLVARI